jgi:hypothetical protein
VILVYYLAAGLGVASVYVIRSIGAALLLWSRLGIHYSTHTAFAVTLGVSIAISRPRWRWAMGSVVIAYLALILINGYHSAGDVLVSGVVAAAVSFPWHLLLARHGASTGA